MTIREYAVVIDESYHAILLRDLCREAAQKHYDRAFHAVKTKVREDNMTRHECFALYAERFEHIRKEEVRRIEEALGMTDPGENGT